MIKTGRVVFALAGIFGILAIPAVARAETEGSGAELRYSDAVHLEDYEGLVEEAPAEAVSAPLMVALAYGLMWLAVVIFIGLTWRKGEWLRAELQLATRRLEAIEARVDRDRASVAATDQEEDPR